MWRVFRRPGHVHAIRRRGELSPSVRQARRICRCDLVGVGVSLGASVASVPADKRFYVGGAGSVRGLAIACLGRPIERRSDRRTVRARRRWRVAASRSAAALAGPYSSRAAAFPSPASSRSIKACAHGAGFGVRYYTAIGPIRADWRAARSAAQHRRSVPALHQSRAGLLMIRRLIIWLFGGIVASRSSSRYLSS